MKPRVQKEIKDLQKEGIPGITVQVDQNNTRHFLAKIDGPSKSPYEGGVFEVELFCPDEYPMKPPIAIFNTKIWHPNIDHVGRICLDILKDDSKGKWSPALQIRSVFLSIQALLCSPNPDDPLNNEAAEQWSKDENGALKKGIVSKNDIVIIAKEWTKKWAMKK